MSFRFSQRSLRNLQGVHPDLVRVVHAALLETPVDFAVIEGVRTLKRQSQLVAAGASQTMDSRHLGGFAVDLGAYVGSQLRWDLGLYYQIAETMQAVCKRLAVPIRWGGAWTRIDNTSTKPADLVAQYVARAKANKMKAFIDGPHYELPKGIYS